VLRRRRWPLVFCKAHAFGQDDTETVEQCRLSGVGLRPYRAETQTSEDRHWWTPALYCMLEQERSDERRQN
jgi:hypothetical protein